VDIATGAANVAQTNDEVADTAVIAGQNVVAGAETKLAAATKTVGKAEGDVVAATEKLANAEGEVTARQEVATAKHELRDVSQQLVNAIIEEIDTTGVLVGQLNDRQVFSINRALHSAVQRGFLPLDIDTDKLLAILENDYSSPQIQQLMKAFVHEAQFVSLADAMEARGKTDQADRFRAKAADQFERATARAERVGRGAGKDAAVAAARESAKQVARGAAKDVAAETASEAVREAAKEAASSAASSVAQEAASELASITSGSEIAAERRGGAQGADKSGSHR
jgi:hypothetical protein